MAQGMVIYRADGRVDIDTSSVSFNVVDSFLAPKNTSTSRSYPGITGLTLYAAASSAGLFPANAVPTPHTITVTGTTVTASGGNIDQLVTVLAR